MKLFTSARIRELDRYTIEHEPISSSGLMERAADALCDALMGEYPFTVTSFYIVAGPGNNGGDALALARKLCEQGYPVAAHLIHAATRHSGKGTPVSLSPDCRLNRDRLKAEFPSVLQEYLDEKADLPLPEHDAVVVDGLFGSGLSRPLTGGFAAVVRQLNEWPNRRIAIDVPSGLDADAYHKLTDLTVKADLTLSLQFPKPAFFFIENEPFVGRWKVLDIGLHPRGIAEAESAWIYMDAEEMKPLLRKRSRFAHKGNFGHLAIIAGSKGMAGASILAAKAALRSGVGLLTLHGPEGNRCILQTVTPEVMFEADRNTDCVSEFYHSDRYDALAIGCGLGTRTVTVEMLRQFLNHLNEPCVFDADALNIMAAHPKMLESLPEGSILTPHPKEFIRLFGDSPNSYHRLMKAREMAMQYQIVLVMKGAYTKVVAPDGTIYFNSTGNPGMATAGSGDVLTGIIGSLLAQGYHPVTAARLGVYLHGLSADLALEQESEESLMAGDIIAGLGKAFRMLAG
ncbi:MAG: hypothetical protein BGP01_02030 [Paludibacter sp. 47-17]|nr:MAG: hypothetical protein ABS72_04560 [Paludibacter sp. SCN 50-10]OJX91628.1 MAG: hypothetical protein BGP01_02030 [Paludibacter sp. 47-17]